MSMMNWSIISISNNQGLKTQILIEVDVVGKYTGFNKIICTRYLTEP